MPPQPADVSHAKEAGDVFLALSRHASGAAAARRLVEQTLNAWKLGTMIDDVSIVVTELLENVIKHAESDGSLRLRRAADSVFVEVSDNSASSPVKQPSTTTAFSGRGLLMVEAIARHWGISTQDGGKTVWAEIAVA